MEKRKQFIKGKMWLGFMLVVIFACVGFKPINSQAASVVSSRLKVIQKQYPNGSYFHAVTFSQIQKKAHGKTYVEKATCSQCMGLVSYVTMRVFHNPYLPGATNFQQIGKTTSSTNQVKLKKLFKKAKVGDVVEFKSGKQRKHDAIFLSYNKKGIYVYEANFDRKNKVYNKHLWKWSNIKRWSHGAKQVSVYRSRNYAKVNQKKAARYLKVGSKFTYDGVTYQVTSNGVKGGTCVIIDDRQLIEVGGKTSGEPGKYVSVNYETSDFLNRKGKLKTAKRIRYITYETKPVYIVGEQFFEVVK